MLKKTISPLNDWVHLLYWKGNCKSVIWHGEKWRIFKKTINLKAKLPFFFFEICKVKLPSGRNGWIVSYALKNYPLLYKTPNNLKQKPWFPLVNGW